MNLRKDHSHASTCLNLKYEREVLGGGSASDSRVEFRGQQIGVALSCCFDPAAVVSLLSLLTCVALCLLQLILLQLSAMDVSARTTMKGAAKCDNLCELQNSVNQ